MTIVAERRTSVLDSVLGVLGELMITLGVVILLFVGWQLWWTDAVSDRAQASIAGHLQDSWPETSSAQQQPPVEPDWGTAFALVHIPRFGSEWKPRPLLEGTSLDVLADGMGHYKDTAMPGQIGNLAIAGHRVTYARPLFQIADLQVGDAIVIETKDGWYTYRMTSREIVSPRDVDVIAPVPDHPEQEPTERMLTLTACHPKYSAKQRFIVHAKYESWQPRDGKNPASLRLPAGVS